MIIEIGSSSNFSMFVLLVTEFNQSFLELVIVTAFTYTFHQCVLHIFCEYFDINFYVSIICAISVILGYAILKFLLVTSNHQKQY